MLLRPRADGYRGAHPTATDMLLLIEVADSSLAYDRGAKLDLYASFGVAEVWIVDLVGRAIEVYREPVDAAYRRRQRLPEGHATPLLLPHLVIQVEALLG